MLLKQQISAGMIGHLACMQTLPRHKQFQFRISHRAREGNIAVFFCKQDRGRDKDKLLVDVKYHRYKAAKQIVAEHSLAGVVVEIFVTS